MFWSGNYIVVRELNFLLKEENVSLSQVLEADDILQECKADNKALIQFLTRPEVLSELITLITEEPPQHVELAAQYRLASVACEVLTSHLATLSDRLSLDVAQMHRLCDFINREPPLNPLLASYFSKTVEMLLERSPKQDWYLYHIVCLRVLDFFKARRDFLPNLLRHLATSAIADTFKYFIRLDDLFNKFVMEWFEEHQLLECLIQIICGSYVPEPLVPRHNAPASAPALDDNLNHKEDAKSDDALSNAVNNSESCESHGACVRANGAQAAAEVGAEERLCRMAAVASANAAGLLCDLVLNGCAPEGCATRARTSWVLVSRLQAEESVRLVLQGMFTAPPKAQRPALVHGCQLLLALTSASAAGVGVGASPERCSVELGVAPHLPLLHHALLHAPPDACPYLPPTQYTAYETAEGRGEGEGGVGGSRQEVGSEGAGCGVRVGAARLQVAALLAQLAASEVEEVATTMLTLGTAGVLVELFFRHPHNNFLHARVLTFVDNALSNRVYRARYAHHLLVECDLLTRLMDAFEENEAKKVVGGARSAYMGHVVCLLGRVWRALEAGGDVSPPTLPEDAARRWPAFRDTALQPALHAHDTPLGGFYPSENVYEVENADDALEATYQFNDMVTTGLEDIGEEIHPEDGGQMCGGSGAGAGGGGGGGQLADGFDDDMRTEAKKNFLQLVSERFADGNMWDDIPEGEGEAEAEASAEMNAEAFGGPLPQELLPDVSPWDAANEESSSGEGWAQFASDAFDPPADPFAVPPAPAPALPSAPFPDHFQHEFSPFWSCAKGGHTDTDTSTLELERNMSQLRITDDKPLQGSGDELANNLLTAMSGMAPEEVANIVNSNMPCSAPAESGVTVEPGVTAESGVTVVPDVTTESKIPTNPGDAAESGVTAEPGATAELERVTTVPIEASVTTVPTELFVTTESSEPFATNISTAIEAGITAKSTIAAQLETLNASSISTEAERGVPSVIAEPSKAIEPSVTIEPSNTVDVVTAAEPIRIVEPAVTVEPTAMVEPTVTTESIEPSAPSDNTTTSES